MRLPWVFKQEEGGETDSRQTETEKTEAGRLTKRDRGRHRERGEKWRIRTRTDRQTDRQTEKQ